MALQKYGPLVPKAWFYRYDGTNAQDFVDLFPEYLRVGEDGKLWLIDDIATAPFEPGWFDPRLGGIQGAEEILGIYGELPRPTE